MTEPRWFTTFPFPWQPGEILGLVGESGSGKSTLIKAAMGLLGDNGLVTRGDITFGGRSLVDMPESELRAVRGAKIGMIFQDAVPLFARFEPLVIRYMRVCVPMERL